MSELISVVFSNDLKVLSNHLIDFLFASDTTPFEKRLVIVPDRAIKEFLLRSFISHPQLGIAAGVQIVPLNQVISKGLGNEGPLLSEKKIPSLMTLSLCIEEKLYQSASSIDYLKVDDPEVREKRIAALSDALAQLFLGYGQYATRGLPEWLEGELPNWQKEIWKDIFSHDSPWGYPLELLTEAKPFQGRLAVFGFPFLPAVYLHYFSERGAHLFLSSPCRLFWEDFLTQKDQLRLHKRLQKKQKVIEQLESYDAHDHPLLANWGKLNREMLKNLGSFDFYEEDEYREVTAPTLLGAMQRSFLNLDAQPIKRDKSIQIHSAPSKLREVEALFDTLMTLFKQHEDEIISLSDVFVFAPNISEYAPYIQAVFGKSDLPFCIEGLELVTVSSVAQGFFSLIELPEENFSLTSIFKLFHNPCFLEKQGFAYEEMGQLKKWFKAAAVESGLSKSANSWEAGIARLLQGCALFPQADRLVEYWPLEALGQTDLDLFNRFLSLFSEIVDDLRALQAKWTPSSWIRYFLKLLEKYFVASGENAIFFQDLQMLGSTVGHCDTAISYASIFRVLNRIGKKKCGKKGGKELTRICFSPLSKDSVVPARIIALLGMNEGAFPRCSEKSSLDVMRNSADYFPTSADEDRACFLSVILHAKDYLLFSYERIHAEDHQAQSYSPLIDELEQYINTPLLRVDHPALSFDLSYFQSDSSIHKFNPMDAKAAQSYFYSEKSTGNRFFLHALPQTLESEEKIVTLKDLRSFARNPLEFYFHKALHLYVKEEEDLQEKSFVLPRMEKGLMRKHCFKKSYEDVVFKSGAQGKLPKGLFQEASLVSFKDEMLGYYTHFSTLGILPERIHSLHLTRKTRFSSHSLEVSGSFGTIHIVGELENVSDKGLLFNGADDVKSIVQAWPLYLVYRCLNPAHTKLLMLKDATVLEYEIESPLDALSSYLEYYLLGTCRPSPLVPQFAKAVFAQSQSDFAKAVKTSAESDFSSYNDLYISYLQRRGALEEWVEQFASWSPHISRAFHSYLGGSHAAF